MKKLIITLILFTMAATTYADVYTQGHYRSDGTWVNPYYRTNPDSNPYNNYDSYRRPSQYGR